jgi:hypothetical protein
MKLINLIGKRFGRWRVVGYAGGGKWFCTCNCDTRRAVVGQSLRQGGSRSCGCLKVELTRARFTKRDAFSARVIEALLEFAPAAFDEEDAA